MQNPGWNGHRDAVGNRERSRATLNRHANRVKGWTRPQTTRLRAGAARLFLLLGLTILFGWAVSVPGAEAQIRFDIPAPTAILIEAETGRVLWEKEADLQTEPASLAKLMTMLLTFEAVEEGLATWNDRVTTSAYAASVGGTTAYLTRGESFTLREMMEAITIASANDATVAVAEFLAGTEEAFVEAMNRRARELGLTNTVYINSDGLPPRADQQGTNLTTARDVATLARHLINRFPEVLEWSSTWQKVFRERPRFVLTNTNRLITRYPGADGLKTGYTSSAGYNLAATAQRDGLRLISVVLRTESDQARIEQTERLLDFGFRNFHRVNAAAEGEPVGEIRVPDGNPERVPVRASAALTVVARRGEERLLERHLEPREGLRAPVAAGDVVGHLVVTAEGQELGRVPVVAQQDVGRAGFFVNLWRRLRDAVGGLLAGDR